MRVEQVETRQDNETPTSFTQETSVCSLPRKSTRLYLCRDCLLGVAGIALGLERTQHLYISFKEYKDHNAPPHPSTTC